MTTYVQTNEGSPEPKPAGQPSTPQNRITVARFKAIGEIIGARRYLEVGVARGQTFLHLDFAEMHAVDPAFAFDMASESRADRSFFPMTSDAFFGSPPDAKPYDLIYLDGLHTFEQTFRDFCSCQALSHPGTVIVIDDTVPSDIFSFIPDQRACNQLRAAHGLKGRAWHGNVCNVIFAIHDFFANVDYRTVIDDGNPQTVLIRTPRPAFKPRWNSLETISRMDYRAFQANIDAMNGCTNAEMLEWISAHT